MQNDVKLQSDEKLKKYTLVTTCFASFIAPFISQAVNIAAPDIGTTFQASPSTLSWVVSSFFVFSAALLLPIGRLADIVGRKKLFIPALILFTLSSFLCAFAWSIQWLIAFRVVQGISGLSNAVISVAILSSVYPVEERGKTIGMIAMSIYLGSAVGPVLGGFLTHNWGWPSVFIACGIICSITLILALQLKGEWVGSPGEAFDWHGSVLFFIGVSALLYGFSSLHEHWIYLLSLLIGLTALVLFFRYEMRAEYPLLPVRQLKNNKIFTYSCFSFLIGYSTTFGIGFLLSLYTQSVLGYNAQTTGLIILPYAIVMSAISPFAGRLSDRMPPRTVASWGMTLCMAGLILFAFIGLDTSVYYIITCLLLVGCGFGIFSSPNSNAIMSSVESKFYGVASSAIGTVRYSGVSIAMALASIVLSNYVGSMQLAEAPPELLLAGIKTAFGISAAVSVLAIAASRKKIENSTK